MTTRTLRALEQLAARPGTSDEGIVARQKLALLRQKHVPSLRFGFGGTPVPQKYWNCQCGFPSKIGDKCRNHGQHEHIRTEIQKRFTKGDRVYYNYWAYSANCPATVIGYPKIPNGQNWDWIRVKFDHLKSGYRCIPIHSEKGWHLSHEPLDPSQG